MNTDIKINEIVKMENNATPLNFCFGKYIYFL